MKALVMAAVAFIIALAYKLFRKPKQPIETPPEPETDNYEDDLGQIKKDVRQPVNLSDDGLGAWLDAYFRRNGSD